MKRLRCLGFLVGFVDSEQSRGSHTRRLCAAGTGTNGFRYPATKKVAESSDLHSRLRYSAKVKRCLFHDRHDHVNAWPDV